MNKYSSEHNQDKWLSENLFKGKQDGVFVEFGALDGLLHSNSLYFEREMGWTGLCIEPHPESYKQLTKNRDCKCLNYAIGDKKAMVNFTSVSGGLIGWSGVEDYIEDKHKERMDKHIAPSQIETTKVQMVPLYDALYEAKMCHIDYMSIDVEGAEYPLLEAFSKANGFCTYDIEVFDIENNFKTFPIEKLMNDNGYVKIIDLDINEIYVRE